jgi:starch synthase
MRILHVSAFFESHTGGIEIVAGALARAVAQLGHDSQWAAANFDSPPAESTVEPVALDSFDPLERWTGLPMPLPRRAGRKALERAIVEADAVVIHDALYASSQLASRLAERHRKPWLVIQHIGAIPYRSKFLRWVMSGANRYATRPLLERAPQAVFISEQVRQHFTGIRFRSPPKLLFNGVDRDTFRPPQTGESTRLRQQLGLDPDRRQLLFVGRFVEKKGLEALRLMAPAVPDCDFLMVGNGPVDPAAWALPNVIVLGRKERRELAELYRAADALILPSFGEGFPLVIQEAMASGLPVFCGLDSADADPGAAGFLHGVVVNPSDPGATAARFVKAIASTPTDRSEAIARYARATYDWSTNARWIVDRLKELRA